MAYLEKNFEFEQDGKMYSLYDLPDGFVIKGNVDLSDRDLTELPDLSKVTIIGGFYCHENQLTSLHGAPQKIDGDFACEYNDGLSSLFGIPEMSEYDEISCDKALMEKYGCPESDNEGIYYKDLIASTKYQSELSAHKIRQKKHEENKVNQAQFKAGYAAFKKKFKPAEREE